MKYKAWEQGDRNAMVLRLIEDGGDLDLCIVDNSGESEVLLLTIKDKKIILYTLDSNGKEALEADKKGYPVVEFA